MSEKEQLEAILEGLSKRMQKMTKEIEQVDGELEWCLEAQASDTVLDSIRHLEIKLQAKYADRAALFNKSTRLRRKLQKMQ